MSLNKYTNRGLLPSQKNEERWLSVFNTINSDLLGCANEDFDWMIFFLAVLSSLSCLNSLICFDFFFILSVFQFLFSSTLFLIPFPPPFSPPCYIYNWTLKIFWPNPRHKIWPNDQSLFWNPALFMLRTFLHPHMFSFQFIIFCFYLSFCILPFVHILYSFSIAPPCTFSLISFCVTLLSYCSPCPFRKSFNNVDMRISIT